MPGVKKGPFRWSEEDIRFYLDASAYTGFHSKLKEQLAPFVAGAGSFCDVGCGLGRIDLELAPLVRSVTCVDINPEVLARLKADAAAQGLARFQVLCGDAFALEGRYDVVFMSFFGRRGGVSGLLPLAKERIIQVVNTADSSGLYPASHRAGSKHVAADIRRGLEEAGLRYTETRCTLEFGQPFRQRGEALRFVRQKAPLASDAEIQEFLDEKLQKADGGFRCYLPNKKDLNIFVIDAKTPRASGG